MAAVTDPPAKGRVHGHALPQVQFKPIFLCWGFYLFGWFFSRKKRKSKFYSQLNFLLGKSIKLNLILQLASRKRKLYVVHG